MVPGILLAAAVLVGCGSSDHEPGAVGSMRFADLQQAADRAADCLRSEGFTGVEVDYADDAWVHGFSVSEDLDVADEQRVQSCLDEHYQMIADHWQALHAATIDAQNRAIEERIIACLDERGFSITTIDDATRDEIDGKDPDARRECILQAADADG